MLTYLQANMGQIEPPIDPTIERSHEELDKEHQRQASGMNWIRAFDPATNTTTLWHNGGTGGCRSFLGITEGKKFGVVVLTHSANDVDHLSSEILEELVERLTCPQLGNQSMG